MASNSSDEKGTAMIDRSATRQQEETSTSSLHGRLGESKRRWLFIMLHVCLYTAYWGYLRIRSTIDGWTAYDFNNVSSGTDFVEALVMLPTCYVLVVCFAMVVAEAPKYGRYYSNAIRRPTSSSSASTPWSEAGELKVIGLSMITVLGIYTLAYGSYPIAKTYDAWTAYRTGGSLALGEFISEGLKTLSLYICVGGVAYLIPELWFDSLQYKQSKIDLHAETKVETAKLSSAQQLGRIGFEKRVQFMNAAILSIVIWQGGRLMEEWDILGSDDALEGNSAGDFRRQVLVTVSIFCLVGVVSRTVAFRLWPQ